MVGTRTAGRPARRHACRARVAWWYSAAAKATLSCGSWRKVLVVASTCELAARVPVWPAGGPREYTSDKAAGHVSRLQGTDGLVGLGLVVVGLGESHLVLQLLEQGFCGGLDLRVGSVGAVEVLELERLIVVGQRRLRYQGTCILVGGKGYRGYR